MCCMLVCKTSVVSGCGVVVPGSFSRSCCVLGGLSFNYFVDSIILLCELLVCLMYQDLNLNL